MFSSDTIDENLVLLVIQGAITGKKAKPESRTYVGSACVEWQSVSSNKGLADYYLENPGIASLRYYGHFTNKFDRGGQVLRNNGEFFSDVIKSSRFRQRVSLGIALLLIFTGSAGRLAVATEQDPSARELWQDESPALNLTAPGQESPRILRLDTLALRRLLAGAPDEVYREADDRRVVPTLPN